MPGPVSDSFDPEFGTGDNATRVADAIRTVVNRLDGVLDARRYIVNVVDGPDGSKMIIDLTERELRVIRFGLERALETI